MRINEAYRVLGLDPHCSEQEVKKAYRTKAKYYHPDLNKSVDAEENFKKVHEAYETIMDYLTSNSFNNTNYSDGSKYDEAGDPDNYYYDYPEDDEPGYELNYEEKKFFLNYLKQQNCLITWVNQAYWTFMIPEEYSDGLITALWEKQYDQLMSFADLPDELSEMSFDFYCGTYGMFIWEFMLGIYEQHQQEIQSRRIIDYRLFYPSDSRLFNYDYCPEFLKPRDFVHWIFQSPYLIYWINDCLQLISYPNLNKNYKRNLYLDLTTKAYKEFQRYFSKTNSITYFRGCLHSIVYDWSLQIYREGYNHIDQQTLDRILDNRNKKKFMDEDEDSPICKKTSWVDRIFEKNGLLHWAWIIVLAIAIALIPIIAELVVR